MKTDEPFKHPPFRLAFRGFDFLLPREWEVVSYHFNEKNAIFLFSSRKGAHGQFSWRKTDAVPDKERIIEEIHRRRLNQDTIPKIRFTKYGPDGNVVLANTAPGECFYASVFNPAERLLCEWIFPAWTRENADTVIPMLNSFRMNKPDSDGRIHYAMFGLEADIPERFDFKEVEPLPAAVTMKFENSSHHRMEIHRWGMADLLLQGADTLNFYHRYLYAKRYAVKKTARRDAFPFDNAQITCRSRGRAGFDFFLGPWWTVAAEAFLKQSENRIYAVEHIAPARVKDRETIRSVFASKLAEKPS